MTWPTKKLGEVLEYEQPTKYLVGSTDYKDEYQTPVLTAGKSFFLGNTDEKTGIFPKEKLPVIIFDDFTTAIKFVDFPFKVKSSAMKILHAKKNEADIRFLFYKMLTIKFQHNQHKRYWISECSNLKISVPPVRVQKKIVGRLDKIVEAQKLNDELIKKTDELFQSLLHKELSPAGKVWKEDKFVNCIEKNPLKIKGIPREKYQTTGKFPIVDQSDKFIVGYTDDESRIYKMDSPVIIFGDHTRIFKYIDFNFAIGADGTQIIIPDKKKFIPEFFYFLMLNLKIDNLGYSRHFKILKTKKINIPTVEDQKKIVAKLSAVQDYKKQLLEQKAKLKELFDSVLSKSIKNEL